ncbi:hypothetical protein LCGC14_1537500 [marine sediment metagenome]|uniref:Uncharacterized protein n=1 Tax=marine sediment metagenome TaxID=412755 RepID=A0A0F9JF07_9ZZZZ
MSESKPEKAEEDQVEATKEKTAGEVSLSKLKPGDVFVYRGDRYTRASAGKKKVKVILLTQAQVGATATEEKTIEYGVSRLELPKDTQVLKSQPLPSG